MRGRHRRPSRTASLITTAAGGTVTFGVIAVSAVPGAQASAPPTASPVNSPPVHAQVNSIREQFPRTVTVQSGQSLSEIAGQECGNTAYWSGIFAANRGKIKDYNLIYPGQVLTIACKTAYVPVETVASAAVPQKQYHREVAVRASPVRETAVSTAGMGGFQACVIRAESGGNPQIWNHQGYPYWGLYQFGHSTWVAHGGASADWGHAGPAEQTQVFWNTVHADGDSDWRPSDGCVL
jgi:LysM repeat protein